MNHENTINVVYTQYGVGQPFPKIYAFRDDALKLADELFRKILRQNTNLSNEDIESYVEDSNYECDDFSLAIIDSLDPDSLGY